MATTYTSTEVVELTGVSYRKLDYWCRNFVVPDQSDPGSGNKRTFTEEQLADIQFCARINRCLEAEGIQTPIALLIKATTQRRLVPNSVGLSIQLGDGVLILGEGLEP